MLSKLLNHTNKLFIAGAVIASAVLAYRGARPSHVAPSLPAALWQATASPAFAWPVDCCPGPGECPPDCP